jgi:hypothetical protein
MYSYYNGGDEEDYEYTAQSYQSVQLSKRGDMTYRMQHIVLALNHLFGNR